MIKKIILLTFTLCIVFTSFSQTIRFKDTGSIGNQFDYLLEKSNRYQDFKVVKINWILQLKSNVADSLSASKKEILDNYGVINTQKNTIDSLKIELTESKGTIESLNTEKQSVKLFGIPLKKGIFKTIMFTVIGILVLLLAFFMTKFKQSNLITKQTLNSLKELEDEFDQHRKVALEREQKVMRRLQDELNKHKKE